MKRILVIDDDAQVHTLIPLIFEQCNYHIKSTLHIGNLEDLINEYKPDLIILDIMLGDVDGRYICTYLKSKPLFEAIPIILVSGIITEVDLQGCKPDAFITKPFNIDELIQQVDDLVYV
ncbi:response regulator [Pedobacter paludis]|uniref:Response regulator n=1 Tax=Pedobacter paludis TaxID=2203212 RepID=A0A317F278_9SPHI|nr:response regulator [Pedobacter paludis]PWS33274.1 response regulator [Pedobacter paludis]